MGPTTAIGHSLFLLWKNSLRKIWVNYLLYSSCIKIRITSSNLVDSWGKSTHLQITQYVGNRATLFLLHYKIRLLIVYHSLNVTYWKNIQKSCCRSCAQFYNWILEDYCVLKGSYWCFVFISRMFYSVDSFVLATHCNKNWCLVNNTHLLIFLFKTITMIM